MTDPGSESRLEGREERRAKMINGMEKRTETKAVNPRSENWLAPPPALAMTEGKVKIGLRSGRRVRPPLYAQSTVTLVPQYASPVSARRTLSEWTLFSVWQRLHCTCKVLPY